MMPSYRAQDLRDLCNRCWMFPKARGSTLCRFCVDFYGLVARSDQKVAELLEKRANGPLGDEFAADSHF